MLYMTDDGGNYAPLDRCKIVDLTDEQMEELADGAEMHQLDPEPESRPVPLLTDDERELIEEGLNYLEENGAPSMGWRGGTKKMETAVESITTKLGI